MALFDYYVTTDLFVNASDLRYNSCLDPMLEKHAQWQRTVLAKLLHMLCDFLLLCYFGYYYAHTGIYLITYYPYLVVLSSSIKYFGSWHI